MTRPDAREGTDWHLLAVMVALLLLMAFLAHVWDVKP